MSEYGKVVLDVRLKGSGLKTAAANSTTSHYHNFDFDCLMNGVEMYAFTSTKGDNVTMSVEYYNGTVWRRYKKFSKTVMVFPAVLQKYVLIPAEPVDGMRIKIDYINTHASNAAEFCFNVFQFTNIEAVDPTQDEQGEDW